MPNVKEIAKKLGIHELEIISAMEKKSIDALVLQELKNNPSHSEVVSFLCIKTLNDETGEACCAYLDKTYIDEMNLPTLIERLLKIEPELLSLKGKGLATEKCDYFYHRTAITSLSIETRFDCCQKIRDEGLKNDAIEKIDMFIIELLTNKSELSLEGIKPLLRAANSKEAENACIFARDSMIADMFKKGVSKKEQMDLLHACRTPIFKQTCLEVLDTEIFEKIESLIKKEKPGDDFNVQLMNLHGKTKSEKCKKDCLVAIDQISIRGLYKKRNEGAVLRIAYKSARSRWGRGEIIRIMTGTDAMAKKADVA